MDLVYEPLPAGSYTRLLHVRTVGLVKTDFECLFEIANLDPGADETQMPTAYTAISYCWGDSAPTSRLKFANGQSLPISQTLRDLLLCLADSRQDGLRNPLHLGQSVGITLWIDAICINQADILEREIQVDLMHRVYSSAAQVLVWLGASTPDSRQAFMETATVDSLVLFSRPWFRRAWVVQEFALNPHVYFAWGADCRPLEWVKHMMNCCFRMLLQKTSFTHGISDEVPDSVLGLNSLASLMTVREKFLKSGGKGLPWETLAMIAKASEASDLRDKVFAFRGIAERVQHGLPRPDYDPPCPHVHADLRTDDSSEEAYRRAVDKVYTDTARALLCNGCTMTLLALAGECNGSGRGGLPTWAPDLDPPTPPIIFAMDLIDMAKWNAGGQEIRAAVPVAGAHQMIRLPARGFEVVDTVLPCFAMDSVAGQKEAMEQLMALRGRHFGIMSDHAWHDMLCDFLTLGLPREYHRPWYILPPGSQGITREDLRASLAAWLARTRTGTSDDDAAAIQAKAFHHPILSFVPPDWCIFATRGGLLGIGPSATTRAGDLVFLVPGCRIPLLFRPTRAEKWEQETAPCMRLQGWCYVHGAMLGEKESWGFRDWELCVE